MTQSEAIYRARQYTGRGNSTGRNSTQGETVLRGEAIGTERGSHTTPGHRAFGER